MLVAYRVVGMIPMSVNSVSPSVHQVSVIFRDHRAPAVCSLAVLGLMLRIRQVATYWSRRRADLGGGYLFSAAKLSSATRRISYLLTIRAHPSDHGSTKAHCDTITFPNLHRPCSTPSFLHSSIQINTSSSHEGTGSLHH